MKLLNAAKYFDRQVCFDPFAVTRTFKAQLDVFDDSKRDGATPVRRVLSAAPGVVMPTSGCVQVGTDVYVLGARHEDLFNGTPIRNSYVMQLADGLAEIKTLAQVAAGTAGVKTYAGRIWVKDLKEQDQSSGLFPYFDLFLASSVTVLDAAVVTLTGKLYIVRTRYNSPAGFLAIEASELLSTAVQSVVYNPKSGSAYNPATDNVTALASVTCNAVVLRYEDSYSRNSISAAKNQAGDVTLALPKVSVTAAVAGDTWAGSGVNFRVYTVNQDAAGTSWLLHSRRV